MRVAIAPPRLGDVESGRFSPVRHGGTDMYIFKSCPKCRGDLALEQGSVNGKLLGPDTDFACLQCGYYLQPAERRDLIVRIVKSHRSRRRAAQLPAAA
jgi:hypothetical protein